MITTTLSVCAELQPSPRVLGLGAGWRSGSACCHVAERCQVAERWVPERDSREGLWTHAAQSLCVREDNGVCGPIAAEIFNKSLC